MENNGKIIKISAMFLGAAVLLLGTFAFLPAGSDGDMMVPDDAQMEIIYAGQHTEVGYVYVWNDADLETLYVKYDMTAEGWMLAETHLAVADSLDDIPQAGNGNPIPGQFPYKTDHDPVVDNYTYEVNITGLYECNETLYIAAHSVVRYYEEGQEKQSETGWTGEEDFPGRNWAVYFTYNLTCDDEPEPDPPIIGISSFGFEDLPLVKNGQGEYIGNDWDYNDFVFDVNISAGYDGNDLEWMQFVFSAEARIAGYEHNLNLAIPTDTFAFNGTYDVYRYMNGMMTSINSSAGNSFDSTSDFDMVMFWNTPTAVSGDYVTVVNITFDTSFPFDLTAYEYGDLDAHATGLFFDPYLKVLNTGETIHIGDLRMVYVPVDWEWVNVDGTPIWDDDWYPYNGVDTGVDHDMVENKPVFYGDWYTI